MEQKLFPPLTFKTLTVDSVKRGAGTIQLSLTKLLTWFVIVCETDVFEKCYHLHCCIQSDRDEQKQRTTKMATSNMCLFPLCPLEGELERHATLSICACVEYPCVMYVRCMCGIGVEMDMATWYCSGACP